MLVSRRGLIASINKWKDAKDKMTDPRMLSYCDGCINTLEAVTDMRKGTDPDIVALLDVQETLD
jgi:hypothetical protein